MENQHSNPIEEETSENSIEDETSENYISDNDDDKNMILPFYSKTANLSINQEVMCYPTRLDKQAGVYVSLPEFAGKTGFIPISEISDSKRERETKRRRHRKSFGSALRVFRAETRLTVYRPVYI